MGTAAVLSGLQAGDELYQQIYASAWQLESSQAYHALLVLLGMFMPLLAAEKFILCLYAVTFTVSLWYLTSSVHGRHEAVLLGLPVIFTGVLYMGFFSSCLAFVAAMYSLGVFFRLYENFTWHRMVLLSGALILTYFLHIFVLLVLLLAMVLLSLARYIACLRHFKSLQFPSLTLARNFPWASTTGWIVAALPSVVLVIHFMATTNESDSTDSSSLLQQSGSVVSFNAFQLMAKVYHILLTFSLLDLLIQLPWFILLAWVTMTCLRTRKEMAGSRTSMTAFNHSYLWIAFVAVLLLIVIMPVTSGPIVILDKRLTPFLFVAWVLWLSTGALSPRQWHLFAWLATLVVGAQLIYRFPAHANLNADIAEYVQAHVKIPAQSSMLSIDMGPETHGYLALGGQHLQFNHIVHAGGYLVLEKSLVNIRNYQLGHPYFPIRFKPGISLSQESPMWNDSTFIFDLSVTERQPVPALATVTVFSDLARPEKQRAFESLQSALIRHGFRETFISSPRGLAKVFSK